MSEDKIETTEIGGSNEDPRLAASQAWKNFGANAPKRVVADLMHDAAGRQLVVPGDPIATGQLIGRRDLALELLSKMGVV